MVARPEASPDAVVLLSGGLDSATVLALAVEQGRRCHAVSFRYGQRHSIELESARRVAASLGAHRHHIVDLDLASVGGSALTADLPVPRHERVEDLDPDEIPVTYVPARNTIFLAFGLAWAEVLGASEIFIGVNALDYSGYPDCRPAFIEAFETVANLATRAGVEGRRLSVRAPLIDMDKSTIIELGRSLGVDYGLTTSCYDPGPRGRPCRACDACLLRAQGFARLGLDDPGAAGPSVDPSVDPPSSDEEER